jgi:putative (di)nucleoside polyphosphate hydrolase
MLSNNSEKETRQNSAYRHGVGICLFNSNGHVLVAERRDCHDAWQMPQGGVEKAECPEDTVFREMNEEIGTDNGRIISRIPGFLRYDFLVPWEYRGQEQEWFALLFLGKDTDINVLGNPNKDDSEFVAWKWVPLQKTVDLIVPFKRSVYVAVNEAFTSIGEALARGEDV